MFVAKQGRVDMVETLRKYGAEDDGGEAALLLAAMDLWKLCEKGDLEKVEEAIKNGTDVNAKDDNGWTALYYAAYFGHANVVDVLLGHGVNIDAKGMYGRTALSWATSRGSTEVAELLRKYGAKQ